MINYLGKPGEKQLVIMLGQFDGVHLGHQALINSTLQAAKTADLTATAALFNPLPRELLQTNFSAIMSHDQRLAQIKFYGINNFLVINTDRKFLQLTAIEFVDLLIKHKVAQIVIGRDFRFGCDRQGDIKLLAEHFHVNVVPDVCIDGKRVSSSWCREAIAVEDIMTYKRLTGRNDCAL